MISIRFLFALTALAYICKASGTSIYTPNPGTKALQIAEATKYVLESGCKVHACFALDGSGSINDKEYAKQKDFVEQVGAIMSLDDPKLAAVQFGLRMRRIHRLTDDIDTFLEAVSRSVQMKSRRTFIAPGVSYCIRQLRNTPENYAKKIVLIGDGRGNFDSRLPPYDPKSVVESFTEASENNAVSAVAVNFKTNLPYMVKIVGNKDKVFDVEDWDGLLDRLAEVVKDVCNREAEFI